MRLSASLFMGGVLATLLTPAAFAAPPPNDTPDAAAFFEPYTAENAAPSELQAVAELAEATSDPGVPRCLGAGSFARTVWYRIPASADVRELTVEAIGRRSDVLDLAAFVQLPFEAPPLTSLPNVCAGEGIGAADAAPDRASAVALRVPASHAVLVQVGRRGPAGRPEDEQAVVTLSETALPPDPEPAGDRPVYGPSTPTVRLNRGALVGLTGATTRLEEPAQPACPTLGAVWRRMPVRRKMRLKVSARGGSVDALGAFSGRRPTLRNELDCVDREGRGRLVLVVRARPRRPLWVRLGTHDPGLGARAALRISRARKGDRPSAGGCLASLRPRIRGRLAGRRSVRAWNRANAIVVRLRVRRGPVCDAAMRVVGPRGRVYAAREVAALRGGIEVLRLPRVRRLRRGRYRLLLQAAGAGGTRVAIPTRLSFRLRRP